MIEPPFAITVCGIEELGEHAERSATHVLSILDPDHPVPEAFGQYGEHRRLELRFHDMIEETPGYVLPKESDIEQILAFGRSMLDEAFHSVLLVHCHVGISRSTAAMTLILSQALPSVPSSEILAMVHRIREKAWPNLRMIELGDAMLVRHGTLVAATHALHKLQLAKRPQLAGLMTGLGRGREIAEAG